MGLLKSSLAFVAPAAKIVKRCFAVGNYGLKSDHDHEDKELSQEERERLAAMMKQKVNEVGCGSTVTELKGGEKVIEDASLMFRGQTIVK